MPALSKFTPEAQNAVFEAIRVGNTAEEASAAAGISRATFFVWMARGETGKQADGPYREFREGVEQARAEAEVALVTRISKAAANGSWQAAAWLLERRFAERWTKPERGKIADQDETPKRDAFSAIDELEARRRSA